MKELLSYILENITEKGKFEITEESEGDQISLRVLADPAIIGLIIGKSGNTIKAIQNILRIKGRMENKFVHLNVSELT